VSITAVGTTATVVHTAHGLTNGDKILIAGANEGDYNGTFVTTYIDVDSYSYTMGGSPSSPATGTITATTQDSTVVTLLDGVLVGVKTPATLTSTSLSFKGCNRANGIFRHIYDSEGNKPAMTVTVGIGYSVAGSELDALSVWPYFKFVTDVPEPAVRSFVVVSK
jgi:hypothetical protein